MQDAYEAGVVAGFQSLGLEKEAAGFAARAIPKAIRFAKDVGTSIYGQPLKFIHQLRRGTAMAPGSVLREGFFPKSGLGKALTWGIPAAMALPVIKGNDPDKAEQLGGLAIGSALSNVAFGPLGGLGASLLYGPGEAIGKKVVGLGRGILGKPAATPLPPRHMSQNQYYAAYQRQQHPDNIQEPSSGPYVGN
jgi:hypothetical protein